MLKHLIVSILLLLITAPLVGAAGEVRRNGDAAPAEVVIGGEELAAILDDFLDRQKDVLPQARVRVKNLQPPRPFALPTGAMETEVIPSDPRILGSRRFTVIFRVNGEVVRNVAVRAQVEAIAPVVVAAGDLGRGVVLSHRDLNLAELDLASLRHPCFDPEELVGQKLKQPVRLGAPIDRTLVDFPPLVRRGGAVTINLRRGTLLLTAAGEAQQDGREGDTIRVRNSASRKEILCRVIDAGHVQVEF